MTPTPELIEKVARAISQASSADIHGGEPGDYSADDWQDYEPEARAAIAAMPVGEMREAIECIDERRGEISVAIASAVLNMPYDKLLGSQRKLVATATNKIADMLIAALRTLTKQKDGI